MKLFSLPKFQCCTSSSSAVNPADIDPNPNRNHLSSGKDQEIYDHARIGNQYGDGGKLCDALKKIGVSDYGCDADGKIFCGTNLDLREVQNGIAGISVAGRNFFVESTGQEGRLSIYYEFKGGDEMQKDVHAFVQNLYGAKFSVSSAYSPHVEKIDSKHKNLEHTVFVDMGKNTTIEDLNIGTALFTSGLYGCTATIIKASDSSGKESFFLSHYSNAYEGEEAIKLFISQREGAKFEILFTNNLFDGEPSTLVSELRKVPLCTVQYEAQKNDSVGIMRTAEDTTQIIWE